MNSTTTQSNTTTAQKRDAFCDELNSLLNVYIFNDEITSQMTLDATKSAEEIKKSYDELTNETKRLKIQLEQIKHQANRLTANEYYQRAIRPKKSRKRQILTDIQKANSPFYLCCPICDRFILKTNTTHKLTNVCLSIRVSKEISKKSTRYTLHKKNKIDLIVAYRNALIMQMTYEKLAIKQQEFEKRIKNLELIYIPRKTCDA